MQVEFSNLDYRISNTPKFQDIIDIVKRMRIEDRRELAEVHGVTSAIGTILAVEASREKEVYIGFNKDTPEIIFGLGRCNFSGVGCPWLLATDGIKSVPIATIRSARLFVNNWLDQTPILTNIVDARNTIHLKWLHLLGFKFFPDQREVNHVPIKQFYRIKE